MPLLNSSFSVFIGTILGQNRILATFKIILLLNVISITPLIYLYSLRDLIKRSLRYTTSLKLSPKRRAMYIGFKPSPALIRIGFNLSSLLTALSYL